MPCLRPWHSPGKRLLRIAVPLPEGFYLGIGACRPHIRPKCWGACALQTSPLGSRELRPFTPAPSLLSTGTCVCPVVAQSSPMELPWSCPERPWTWWQGPWWLPPSLSHFLLPSWYFLGSPSRWNLCVSVSGVLWEIENQVFSMALRLVCFFCLFSFVEDLFIKFVSSQKSREMGLQIKQRHLVVEYTRILI